VYSHFRLGAPELLRHSTRRTEETTSPNQRVIHVAEEERPYGQVIEATSDSALYVKRCIRSCSLLIPYSGCIQRTSIRVPPTWSLLIRGELLSLSSHISLEMNLWKNYKLIFTSIVMGRDPRRYVNVVILTVTTVRTNQAHP
jgi:hypothetical protein